MEILLQGHGRHIVLAPLVEVPDQVGLNETTRPRFRSISLVKQSATQSGILGNQESEGDAYVKESIVVHVPKHMDDVSSAEFELGLRTEGEAVSAFRKSTKRGHMTQLANMSASGDSNATERRFTS